MLEIPFRLPILDFLLVGVIEELWRGGVADLADGSGGHEAARASCHVWRVLGRHGAAEAGARPGGPPHWAERTLGGHAGGAECVGRRDHSIGIGVYRLSLHSVIK